MGSETRKKSAHIMVRVSPEDKEQIENAAAQCDLSAPAYLRNLGLAYEPKSNIDAQAIERLAHLHGDMGRVGGLLKLWLVDELKGESAQNLNIPYLVKEILNLQQEIGEVVRGL
jgi:hypothetical protein